MVNLMCTLDQWSPLRIHDVAFNVQYTYHVVAWPYSSHFCASSKYQNQCQSVACLLKLFAEDGVVINRRFHSRLPGRSTTIFSKSTFTSMVFPFPLQQEMDSMHANPAHYKDKTSTHAATLVTQVSLLGSTKLK